MNIASVNYIGVLSNPWIVGIGVSVLSGLVLYYLFGIGKSKSGDSTKKSLHISAGNIIVGNRLVREKETKKENVDPDLRIDFDEKKISWAKYAVGRRVWPSFRMVLLINNFHNKSPEYIRAYMLAKSNDGIWEAKNFVFLNKDNEDKSQPNEDFRIEPEYKETVSLFVSNYDIGLNEPKPLPDIDRDTLKLIVETESGKKFTLPVRAGWIVQG